MKKYRIIITEQAHLEQVQKILFEWGFEWCNGKEILKYHMRIIFVNYFAGKDLTNSNDLSAIIDGPENSKVYLSSDIIADPEIVGTFDGAVKKTRGWTKELILKLKNEFEYVFNKNFEDFIKDFADKYNISE